MSFYKCELICKFSCTYSDDPHSWRKRVLLYSRFSWYNNLINQREKMAENLKKRLREYFNHDWEKFREEQSGLAPDRFEPAAFELLKNWFHERFPDMLPPNDEQARIILDDGLSTLVTARAGSGKTTLLVYKVLFLIFHLHVEPRKILLLAFNKSAAVLIRERIFRAIAGEAAYRDFLDFAARQQNSSYFQRERVLKQMISSAGIVLPQIMTFHALAYQIVRPSPDQFSMTDDTNSLDLQSFYHVLNSQIRDEKILGRYVELILSSFKNTAGGGSGILYTADGKMVYSVHDQAIGNFLFSYKLPYTYRKSRFEDRGYFQIAAGEQVLVNLKSWSDQLSPYESSGRNVITFSDSDYNALGAVKQKAEKEIVRDLEEITGTVLEKSADQEIFSGANYGRDRMMKVFQNLILVCKQRKITPGDFAGLIDNYQPRLQQEKVFDELFLHFYEEYENALTSCGRYDFMKMFDCAAEKLASDFGRSFFTRNLSYVFVDEFQDFSRSYYEVVEQLVKQAEEDIHLVAVGDNWQSINGYAGAELDFFNNFEKYFKDGKRLNLLSNYRSAGDIIDVSNELMAGLGPAARAVIKEPGMVNLITSTRFSSTVDVSLKIAELVNYLLHQKKEQESVIVLVRTQSEIMKLRQLVSSRDVRIQTVHSFKGGEADYVIIDVSQWYFPLIHPDSVYSRIVGITADDLVSEERRLLYVAMTRARSQLYLVAQSQENLSPFISRLKFDFKTVDEHRILKSAGNIDESRRNSVTAVISGKTYQIKEKLKQMGYRYNGDDKSWNKRFPDRGQFDREMITSSFNRDQIVVRLFNYCNQPIKLKI